MPDIRDRDALESALAREVGKTLAAQLPALIRELGDPPKMNNISAAFWTRHGDELRTALRGALEKVYVQQAHDLPAPAGVAVSWDVVNKDAAAWASKYSFELVKGVTETTRTALQSIVEKAIAESQPLGDVRLAIEPLFGVSRAAMIATTEITRAAAEGEADVVAQLAEGGITMRGTWLTREDEKVCPICSDLDGVTQNSDGQFVGASGEYGLPPAHVNCLLGDAVVLPVGAIAATMEREYDGEMVTLSTAGGQHLAATPNHPILTRRGWVTAGALDVGSDVVGCFVGEGESLGDVDDQHMPARIEDVVNSSWRSFHVFATPMPVSAPNLDVNRKRAQVAVIDSNGLLRSSVNAAFIEHSGEGALALGDVETQLLDALGALDLLGFGVDATARGVMGGGNLDGALLGGHARPLDGLGLGLVADVSASDYEIAANYGTRNLVPLREGILGFPAVVAFDKIIGIKRDSFHGKVYNLQTESSIYIANGIVTHNCRCSIAYEVSNG